MDAVALSPRPLRDRELESLTPLERAIARRARQAARIVAAAGLPAEYRAAAYARVLELELTLESDGVQAAA
jgi:hypothetical protein